MFDVLEGIIIDHRDYREQDALLTLLDIQGRCISISAKGIQKVKSKNAPACQLFSHSRMLLNYQETRDMQSLRTAELLDSFRLIREDLMKQSIASYFCEVMLKSRFDDKEAYVMLYTALQILQDAEDGMTILCLFQALINRMHGVEMVCDHCVRCGTQHAIYAISLRDGGFICRQCAKSFDKAYHREDLKRFRLLANAQLEHYSIMEDLGGLRYHHFELLYNFFEEYTGLSMKSARFLSILNHMEKNS